MITINPAVFYDCANNIVNNYRKRIAYNHLNLPNGDFMAFEWERQCGCSVCHIYLATEDHIMENDVIFEYGKIDASVLCKSIMDMVSTGCIGRIAILSSVAA